MPTFSKSSKEKLATCDPELQILFNYVIKYFDCSILCGERGETAQNKAYNDGFSTKKYPNSKHNSSPSEAVDCIPYPVEWENTNRMRYFIGYVMGIAKMLKMYNAMDKEIVSGIDWNDNTILKDQRFNDLPHFEIKN